MPVHVLQALAGQRRAAGGRPDDESARHLIARCPELIARALEAEHRVEDVERDHRDVVSRVRGAHSLEGGHRAGLGDARVQELAALGLLVRKEQVVVHGGVLLAQRVEDLGRREHRVEAEGARLVGNDRHQPESEGLVLGYVFDEAYERHGRGDLLLAGAGGDGVVVLLGGKLDPS